MDRLVQPPIVMAKRDFENSLLVITCPHCHKEHRHGVEPGGRFGSGDGHRGSHCENGEDRDSIGYIVREKH